MSERLVKINLLDQCPDNCGAMEIKALTKCAGVGKRALSVIEELPGVTEKGAER